MEGRYIGDEGAGGGRDWGRYDYDAVYTFLNI